VQDDVVAEVLLELEQPAGHFVKRGRVGDVVAEDAGVCAWGKAE
jgi:hypothetical protein